MHVMYTKSKSQGLNLEKNVLKSYVMREKYCTGVTKSPPIQFCQSLLKTEPLGVVFILFSGKFLGYQWGGIECTNFVPIQSKQVTEKW